jgi:hypothetical protein
MVPVLSASQGAVPRTRCVSAPKEQASVPPPKARLPSLDTLQTDPVLFAQAAALDNDLGVRMAGNIHQNPVNTSATKCGWARAGGDKAPKV